VAFEKYQSIREQAEQVTVIAKSFSELFDPKDRDRKKERFYKRAYRHGDFYGSNLVYICLSDSETLEKIREHTESFPGLVNFVSNPDQSGFSSGAVYEGVDFSIGVSTYGQSPAGASSVRDRIREAVSSEEISQMIEAGKKTRGARGSGAEGEEAAPGKKEKTKLGKVYLIGGGSGVPGDLTGQAFSVLGRAQIVFHDFHLEEGLSSRFPRARWENVGKKRDRHGVSQDTINQKLVDAAKKGWTVVRLKSGDLFFYARLNEEIEALEKNNIFFEIIPGLSAMQLLARVIGKSITDRKRVTALKIITGHNNKPFRADDVDGVLVYMGLRYIKTVIDSFVKSGFNEKSVIYIGSHLGRPEQQLIQGTPGEIIGKIRAAKITSPAIIFGVK